jgi:hypothetical protein
MNTRAIIIALVVVGIAVLLILARKNQKVLHDGLPQRIEVASQAEAKALAGPLGIPVLGTGSMAPYIPAAAVGLDPFTTVCAYVVLVPGATVEAVTPGALCIYVPDWAKRNVMHQASSFVDGGWVMTGLHNKGYENKERMTGSNFVGLVARTYVWHP